MNRQPELRDDAVIPEERIDRLWGEISSRLSPKPSGAIGFEGALLSVVLAASLLVGAFLIVPQLTSESSAVAGGAMLETQSDSLTVTLAEGSVVEVSPTSRVKLIEVTPERVALELSQGRVLCDVEPNPKRLFHVRAAGVEVRVIGTKFSVEHRVDAAGSFIEVRVERGIVEVHGGSATAPQRLNAGQRWSSEERLGFDVRKSAASESERGTEREPRSHHEALPTSIPPAVKNGGSSSASLPEEQKASSAAGAKSLLSEAGNARRAGDVRSAATIYERIVTEYENDPRAGLAAFELGRLRMDSLGDIRGAITALHRALVIAPGGAFKEDVQARLVRAWASLNQATECRRAREEYLTSYPAGIHRAEVSRACP